MTTATPHRARFRAPVHRAPGVSLRCRTANTSHPVATDLPLPGQSATDGHAGASNGTGVHTGAATFAARAGGVVRSLCEDRSTPTEFGLYATLASKVLA